MRIVTLFLMVFLSLSAKNLIFATYPSNTPEKLLAAFTPLNEALQKGLGIETKLIVTKDYEELSQGLSDGSIDIAWIGSSNYIKTRKTLPDLHYLATYLERDASGESITPFYSSVIITLKKSPYSTLKDLKDSNFAFTDMGSTSGYAYPMLMLKRAEIEPDKYFKKIYILKKHDKVVEALVKGSIDVGAVSDGTYFNAKKRYGDIFKIIQKSSPIPLDAIVASPKMSSELMEKIQNILIAIEENSPTNSAIRENLGWKASGFEIKEPSFYDDIEEALQFIN